MPDFTITGAKELEKLGRQLKEAGHGGLRRGLLAAIRKSNKPTIAKIRLSALERLPKRGGLAAEVAASKIGTRTRLTGGSVGVQIKGTGLRNLRTLNAGKLRKPVFGNREVWVEQDVPEGFYDDPINADKPRIQRSIQQAMHDTAKQITRGL